MIHNYIPNHSSVPSARPAYGVVLQQLLRSNYTSLAFSTPAGPSEKEHSDSGRLGESYTCEGKGRGNED